MHKPHFFYGGTRGLTSRDIDFAFYADTTGPITVSYSTVATITSADGVDVTRNVPFVRGSDFDDTFVADGNYLAFSPSGSLSPFVDFRGGDGNDTIIGTGNTLIRAGYSDADGGVTVDFALGTAFGTLVPGGATNIGTDTLVDVVQVRGSNFDDTLLGSDTVAYRENFKGQEGNDFINGRGGLDRADYRSEDAGSIVNLSSVARFGVNAGQALDGYGDTDTLVNIEELRGSRFDDILIGDNNDNRIDGERGDDRIEGGGGNDDLRGDDGNDQIFGGNGDDTIRGGDG